MRSFRIIRPILRERKAPRGGWFAEEIVFPSNELDFLNVVLDGMVLFMRDKAWEDPDDAKVSSKSGRRGGSAQRGTDPLRFEDEPLRRPERHQHLPLGAAHGSADRRGAR